MSLQLYAQDSKLVSGISNFEKGDFPNAIKNLEAATKNPSNLDEDRVAEAWYYLARSYQGEYNRLLSLHQADLSFILKTLEALKQAQLKDRGKWSQKIRGAIGVTALLCDQTALGLINQAQLEKDDDVRKKLLNEAESYLEPLLLIDSTNYLHFGLMGELKESKKMFKEAIPLLENSLRIYRSKKNDRVDLYVGFSAYRLAKMSNDYKTALNYLEDGIALNESEFHRMDTLWQLKHKGLYEDVKNTLLREELQIYIETPALANSAIPKFENLIQQAPEDHVLLLAYAQFLENIDESKAIETYEKIIAMQPKDVTAYFNLSAFYNNKAARISQLHQKELNHEKAAELYKQLTDNLLLAYEKMKLANQVDPHQRNILTSLVTMAMQLGKTEEADAFLDDLNRIPNY